MGCIALCISSCFLMFDFAILFIGVQSIATDLSCKTQKFGKIFMLISFDVYYCYLFVIILLLFVDKKNLVFTTPFYRCSK